MMGTEWKLSSHSTLFFLVNHSLLVPILSRKARLIGLKNVVFFSKKLLFITIYKYMYFLQ